MTSMRLLLELFFDTLVYWTAGCPCTRLPFVCCCTLNRTVCLIKKQTNKQKSFVFVSYFSYFCLGVSVLKFLGNLGKLPS